MEWLTNFFGQLFNPSAATPTPQPQSLDVQGILIKNGLGAMWQDEWRFAETNEDLIRMGGPNPNPLPTRQQYYASKRLPAVAGAAVATAATGATAGARPPANINAPPVANATDDAGPFGYDGESPIPPVASPTDNDGPFGYDVPSPDIVTKARNTVLGGGVPLAMSEAAAKAGRAIIAAEARRDSKGNIAVYRLPSNDGGGSYEVAGINERYHPQAAKMLAGLIQAGNPQEAERQATAYILKYTEKSAKDFKTSGIQYLVRDIAFNRGPGGANAAIRLAIGEDPKNRSAAHRALTQDEIVRAQAFEQKDPVGFAKALTAARETYEYRFVGKRPNLDRGLRNRWQYGWKTSIQLLNEDGTVTTIPQE